MAPQALVTLARTHWQLLIVVVAVPKAEAVAAGSRLDVVETATQLDCQTTPQTGQHAPCLAKGHWSRLTACRLVGSASMDSVAAGTEAEAEAEAAVAGLLVEALSNQGLLKLVCFNACTVSRSCLLLGLPGL